MRDLSNTIHVVNGYEKDAYTYYPLIVVGAGESGIALGCRLKEALGFDQFRVFDRQAGLGGTWWINRYPGVACDMCAFAPLRKDSIGTDIVEDPPSSTASPSLQITSGHLIILQVQKSSIIFKASVTNMK